MVLIPEGTFTPFFLKKTDTNNNAASSASTVAILTEAVPVTTINAFFIDIAPVTNQQFQQFVAKNPDWRKSRVKKIFADSHYLDHWPSDQGVENQGVENKGPENQALDNQATNNSAELNKPVVNVSWFAAAAYCEAQGKRMPSTDEWEYVLTDNDRDKENIQKQTINWYSVPNKDLPAVKSKPANGFGVHDLIGLVWEWTEDFNSYMAPPDSRNSGDKTLFCGSGSLNANNLGDYAAFMRYSYRESLKGNFTGKNLGFRCAKDTK